jgi:hypothetical protein
MTGNVKCVKGHVAHFKALPPKPPERQCRDLKRETPEVAPAPAIAESQRNLCVPDLASKTQCAQSVDKYRS